MRGHTETYERIGDVPVWVHDLEQRWQTEEARARVRVSAEDAILNLSVPTTVPPQVAWAFLTEPGQRMAWQPWVTEVAIKGATGGRRGPGSSNHCMHGEDSVVEEILDWRPYDYVTDRTILDTPSGPVKVLHTIELEPTRTGTTVHFRFGAPKSKRERALMEHIGPAYGEALRSGVPALVTSLEAAQAAQDADRGPEPDLAMPRPDGPLAGMEPLPIVG
ncbi:MAG: SRPBCC family protein [Candidatus Limnocylindrales bacterium]